MADVVPAADGLLLLLLGLGRGLLTSSNGCLGSYSFVCLLVFEKGESCSMIHFLWLLSWGCYCLLRCDFVRCVNKIL